MNCKDWQDAFLPLAGEHARHAFHMVAQADYCLSGKWHKSAAIWESKLEKKILAVEQQVQRIREDYGNAEANFYWHYFDMRLREYELQHTFLSHEYNVREEYNYDYKS